MHELSLFGQVPGSRHEQLLKILAGLARMQPQRLIERHAVYRPNRDPVRAPIQVGASQTVGSQRPKPKADSKRDLYYWQLVKEVVESEFGDQPAAPAVAADEELAPAFGVERRRWTLQFQDLPDAATKQATLRLAQATEIAEGDPHAMMSAQMYNYVSEYIDEGYRFVHNNVVIFLHRILPLPSAGRHSPLESLPPFEALQPLDSSGGYVLQASVRLQDTSKPEIARKGMAELEAFQTAMKGVVEMRPAERLWLDTRLKPKPG